MTDKPPGKSPSVSKAAIAGAALAAEALFGWAVVEAVGWFLTDPIVHDIVAGVFLLVVLVAGLWTIAWAAGMCESSLMRWFRRTPRVPVAELSRRYAKYKSLREQARGIQNFKGLGNWLAECESETVGGDGFVDLMARQHECDHGEQVYGQDALDKLRDDAVGRLTRNMDRLNKRIRAIGTGAAV